MREKIWQRLAWLMPRRLTYWCAIRVGANATTGDYGHELVPELTFMEALARWDKPFVPPGNVRVIT